MHARLSQDRLYYVSQDQQTQGPYTRQQLDLYLKMEELPKEALFWSDGMKTWLPLSRFPDMGRATQEAPTKQAAAPVAKKTSGFLGRWVTPLFALLAISAFAASAV